MCVGVVGYLFVCMLGCLCVCWFVPNAAPGPITRVWPVRVPRTYASHTCQQQRRAGPRTFGQLAHATGPEMQACITWGLNS